VSPGKVSPIVFADRLAGVESMLAEIRSLPLDDRRAFLGDSRNVWTADACLRRALEGLLDVGRHLLAKAFAVGVTEYKQIAVALGEYGVLDEAESVTLSTLAGYRNRITHFYHEVSAAELFDIASSELDDIARLVQAYRGWAARNPDRFGTEL
jgi:uncharacterized protein YutE (UPF0331/DUF86 family)